LKRKIIWAAIALPVVAGAVLLMTHGDGVAWRLDLYAHKIRGHYPQVQRSELVAMTAGRDAYNIGDKIAEGRSLDAAIENPYTSKSDIEAGSHLFHDKCSACHGTNAGGGHAPSLLRASYTHGDSPFSIYRTIRDGVPSTAMAPTGLQAEQRWQVVAYLRKLQREANAAVAVAGAEFFPVDVKAEDLATAGTRTNEWLTYSGSYKGWRHTSLGEITPANVAKLKPMWIRQFPGEAFVNMSTPLVIGDRMFITESPSNVAALDLHTGEILWRYEHFIPKDLPVCCGAVNRGLAALGRNVYVATLDAHLIALDTAKGRVQWETKIADTEQGYTTTVAPLAIGNAIVVGVAGSEYAIRGFIAAFDAKTGKKLWQFDTIPGPGEKGHETWENDAWKTGGGGTWVTGSYDPDLDLVYWGVGNPAPVYQGAVRPGDNLYTASVVALNAKTGKLAWHFQFTPHDEHDWDAGQTPMLADIEVGGTKRNAILWANRNGFYYVLDRKTGEFLSATPFAKQNWALSIDARGRPVLDPARRVTEAGVLTFPSVGGATNWQPPTYDPVRQTVFVHINDQGSVFTNVAPNAVKYGVKNYFVGSGSADAGKPIVGVRALDAATGKMKWERMHEEMRGSGGSSGLLSTAGGVVFGSNSGFAYALDAADGKELWRLSLGGSTSAAPISFELDGRQVVGLWAGRAYFVLGLP
jgi:alcohol dehydrogenase (cytochrome c)